MNGRKSGRSVPKKRAQNKGVAHLTRVADEEIDKNAKQIVDSLREKAAEGNATAVRLLVDLAENAEWVHKPDWVNETLALVESWKKEPEHSTNTASAVQPPTESECAANPTGADGAMPGSSFGAADTNTAVSSPSKVVRSPRRTRERRKHHDVHSLEK